MMKMGLEKEKEPEIELPTFAVPQGKLGNSRKTATSVSLTVPKPLTMWIIINCGKIIRDWNTRPSYLSPEKPICGSKGNS